MCGICGIVSLRGEKIERDALQKSADTMLSRGPDGSGIKIFDNVGIAHRRLSIIDISSGAQPMSNEDETLWITFNGEIYNYLTLRELLAAKGHIFKTSSDTEVILHLFESFGTEAFKMLDGMFAFAIYETEKGRLTVARDRLGKKPLFYYYNGDYFIFGSELQAITSHPHFKKEVNLQALNDFLHFTHIQGKQTIYKETWKLEPASYLTLDVPGKNLTSERYWRPDFSIKSSISFEDAKAELRRLLRIAVEKRLMSEVPLGCFVSGGLDSSIVTLLLSEHLKGDLNTFTIGFDDPAYDERRFAKAVADKFQTKHHIRVVTPGDFSILEKLAANFGEPFADASLIPTYQLCAFASEKITVALSGDGGDEIFGGYYRYNMSRYGRMAEIIPAPLRKFICDSLLKVIPSSHDEKRRAGKVKRVLNMLKENGINRYYNILNKAHDETLNALFSDRMKESIQDKDAPIKFLENHYEMLSADNPVERLMELDMQSYLPYDILTKVDICSMASSLEVRSPMLDYNVIDFAMKLPLRFKNTLFSRKKILLETFRQELPRKVYARGKRGFGVPVGRWIKDKWKKSAEDLLLSSQLARDGLLSQQALNEIFTSHINSRRDYSYLLFSLIVLELWRRN